MGCGNQNSLTTPSGVVVNYLEKGLGDAPQHGEVISVNMDYLDEDDQIIYSTDKSGGPVQFFYDTVGWKSTGLLFEVISNLKVGDSVHFRIPAEDLYHKTFFLRLPDSIRAGSDLNFKIGFVSSFTEEEIDRAEKAEQFKIEEEIINRYLTEKGITAQETGSGLRYIIHEVGDGPRPQYGDEVFIHYEGTLLDGTKFDSSYDRGRPYRFTLGYGRVIEGWDEGVELLHVGSKATFLIPSPLAYGARSTGDKIGPNSILKFDVELIDIQ